jgi:hypothetical protein
MWISQSILSKERKLLEASLLITLEKQLASKGGRRKIKSQIKET